MLQQLADGDLPAVDTLAAQQPREIGLHRLVELDGALADELQDDSGRERLGVAADAHLAVAGYGGAGGELADARAV